MAIDEKSTPQSPDLHEFFARDPAAADRAFFGRETYSDRRGFLRGAGLATMAAMVGAAWFARPGVKLFAEYIRTEGFAPLNFISGGNIRNDRGEIVHDRTHSDRSAHSDVFLLGVNLAF